MSRELRGPEQLREMAQRGATFRQSAGNGGLVGCGCLEVVSLVGKTLQ